MDSQQTNRSLHNHNPSRIFNKYWPLILSLFIFWILFFVLLQVSISGTQGHFIYPLDDSYIHLNIAKNFSQYGIWGISSVSFSSLSSSLLWSLLISLTFFLFSSIEFIPIILTVIIASILLLIIFQIFQKHKIPKRFNFLGLSAIILFTPLLPLVFTRLEHTVHALLTILAVYLSAKILSGNSSSLFEKTGLLILTSAAVMSRYEAIFIIFITGFLFIAKKKWKYSILLFLSGSTPLAVFGLISLEQGWYFFPNSVLLKGRMPDYSSFSGFLNWFIEPWQLALKNPHILLLLLCSLILLFYLLHKYRTFWRSEIIMNAVFIAAVLTHIQFAKLGWFYRYEAYLMVLGIFVITISATKFRFKTQMPVTKKERIKLKSRYVEICLFSLIILSAFTVRGSIAITQIPKACKNIYEQQFQMGLFLKKYYPGESIAANDIGAINYLADIKCLDLWGLSSMEVAKAKRQGNFDTQFIQNIARKNKVKIAVLYDNWFTQYSGLPPSWIKVAEWMIKDNIVCGGHTVSFYAVEASEKNQLLSNLKNFSPELPDDVLEIFKSKH